jgi:hypothetical protein
LRQRQAGVDVQRAQSEALRQLRYVMKAVHPDPKKDGAGGASPGGGDGGGQAGGGSALNVAELRLVAIVQEQIIVRTAELEADRSAGMDLNPAQKAQYEELQKQQAELAEWIFNLSELSDTGPEENPTDILPEDGSGEKNSAKDPESIDELLPSLFGDE